MTFDGGSNGRPRIAWGGNGWEEMSGARWFGCLALGVVDRQAERLSGCAGVG